MISTKLLVVILFTVVFRKAKSKKVHSRMGDNSVIFFQK